MPEGHTIHRLARDHRRDFVAQCLRVSSPQGRFAGGARRLDGRVLQRVEAVGKHLFYGWDGAGVLHIHLGLYGKFRNYSYPPPQPRGQVRLRVVGPRRAFDLNGPNVCELVTPRRAEEIAARLGPDPLRRDADPQRAWRRISRSRAAIGALLLDQSVIAGIGNVYRSEALHAVGLHPGRPGQSLGKEEFALLWSTLKQMLRIGVKYNRIITADPEMLGKTRARLSRDESLLVYKKSCCSACGRPVAAWVLGGRTIYACVRCQPREP
jgi:endonuclease-8